jgi:hypothetical protein
MWRVALSIVMVRQQDRERSAGQAVAPHTESHAAQRAAHPSPVGPGARVQQRVEEVLQCDGDQYRTIAMTTTDTKLDQSD